MRALRGLSMAMLPAVLRAMLLAVAPAQALVRESLSYAYYDVNLRPGQRVMPVMRTATHLGPTPTGAALGQTDPRITWTYDNAWGPNQTCRVNGATVDLASVITLPRLRGADAVQQAGFATFIAALQVHELGHHAIAREQARAIDHVLRSLPASRDCQALVELALQRTRYVMKQYEDKQAQYDRDTGGGRTQGTWMNF